MPNLPEIDTQFLLDFLTMLLNTPSPTGLAEPAIALTEETLQPFKGLKLSRTRKGALLATWLGERDDAPRALTAHADTLGGMVKEVKANGRLKLSQIGGYAWNTIEGEGCTVFTRSGRQVRGSILLTKSSGHVFGKEVEELKRAADTLEVRLDARTASAQETLDLGIGVGDFVASVLVGGLWAVYGVGVGFGASAILCGAGTLALFALLPTARRSPEA